MNQSLLVPLMILSLPPILSGCGFMDSTPASTSVSSAAVTASVNASTEWQVGRRLNLEQDSTAAGTQLPQIDPLEVSGDLRGVGSSTLFPLTQAMYERFVETGYQGVIELNSSGTSRGFELFCQRDADFVNASRPIKPSEAALCRDFELDPIGFGVGLDALAIVVNPANTFVVDVRFGDLEDIFSVERWSDVEPEWPNEFIYRYIPDLGSGTLQFFQDQVLEDDIPLTLLNTDFSGDDTVLVESIGTDPFGVGFVGHAYYLQNQDLLSLVRINEVSLDRESVRANRYPLTRPLFIYTDLDLIREKPQLYAFLNFYFSQVDQEIEKVGYFPSQELLEASKQLFVEGLNLENLVTNPPRSARNQQHTGPQSFEDLQTQRRAIEAAVEPFAEQIATSPIQPDTMFDQLRAYVESNPAVFGATFAYNPWIRSFSPYVFRSRDQLSIKDLAIQSDYANEALWYVDPVAEEQPVWTDPYFDVSGAGRSVLMTTYAVPVYGPDQELIGVLTSDLFLASIEASQLESGKFKVVEAASRTLDQIRQLENPDPELIRESLESYLNAYPYLFGSSFTFPFQVEVANPYLFRTAEGIRDHDPAQDPNTEGPLDPWHQAALTENRPVWSEPYFNSDWSASQKELLMVSLSIPVYTRNPQSFLGVLTTDLVLEAYE